MQQPETPLTAPLPEMRSVEVQGQQNKTRTVRGLSLEKRTLAAVEAANKALAREGKLPPEGMREVPDDLPDSEESDPDVEESEPDKPGLKSPLVEVQGPQTPPRTPPSKKRKQQEMATSTRKSTRKRTPVKR